MIGAVLVVRQKTAPGISQAGNHSCCSGVTHAFPVYRINILFVDDVLNLDITHGLIKVIRTADRANHLIARDHARSEEHYRQQDENHPQVDAEAQKPAQKDADAA